jgi:signal transduction histidine kinase/CheY-like chemotaxis protein
VLALFAVLGFAAWAGFVVRVSDSLRAELRERTTLRMRIDDAVHDLQIHHPQDPAIRTALSDLRLTATGLRFDAGGSGEPRAVLDAVAALEAGLDAMPADGDRADLTERRQRVFETANTLSQRLRGDAGRISAQRERSWVSLEILAACTIGLSALVLGLVLLERRQATSASRLGDQLAAALRDAELARADAQRASRAKSEFLATVSHEIRTPLTAVLGTVELLAGTELNRGQRDYLAVISSGSEALLRLVSDVLDLARIEAGRLELRPKATSIAGLLDGVVLLFAGPAEGRGLALSAVIGPSVPARVRVDEDRLRQVLVNLVGNALKFTEHGEVAVRVTVDGQRLRFAVRDTGPGVPFAVRDRLFAPFEQGVPVRQVGGSGLGLAIARRLVDAMGGSITLESEPGAGACFTVDLPLVDPSAPDAPAPCTARVVGDEPLLVAAREQLTAWGFRMVEPAGSPVDLLVLGRELPSWTPAPGSVIVRLVPLSAGGSDPHAVRGPMRPLALRSAIEGSEPSPPNAVENAVPRDVLIIDDQPTNRQVLADLLRRLGHRVETADGGRDGVIAARQRRFDVVLMDVDMPDVDGFEATRALRDEGGASAKAAIVGLTGHATESSRLIGIDAGMDDWIAKPVRLKDLAAAIARWGNRERVP